jgi:hypothetical protein
VRLHGRLPEAGRNRLLASAWLTVCTSEVEGWGLAVTEAMALGVPAVRSGPEWRAGRRRSGQRRVESSRKELHAGDVGGHRRNRNRALTGRTRFAIRKNRGKASSAPVYELASAVLRAEILIALW